MVKGGQAMIFFRTFLIVIFLALFTASVHGKDFCDSPVVRSWETQRESAAVNLVKLFLRNGTPGAVRETGFELLRLEVLLSSCIPPLKVEDFYLFDLPNSNPDLLPVAILKSYLQKNGVSIEGRGFFRNKVFWLEAK